MYGAVFLEVDPFTGFRVVGVDQWGNQQTIAQGADLNFVLQMATQTTGRKLSLQLAAAEHHVPIMPRPPVIPYGPTVTCPKCGDTVPDFDGFGFLHCSKCGHCKHPSLTEGRCELCGEKRAG